MKAPIFIFSLPRSGSTLLQKVLMSHKEIASVAEPWILLPFVYLQKDKGVLAEYSHQGAYLAINDFIKNLPNNESDYLVELRHFISNLYEKQCRNNEIYFLDKTPRYYLIIPEIAKIFPNAKYIFLFRNPIQIMSSIIQTWGNGRFNNLHSYEIDLNKGQIYLSEGFKLLKDKSYFLKYEDFINNPEKEIKEICEYLDISFDSKMLTYFSRQDTKGIMGDPTGVLMYSQINKQTVKKWEKTFYSRYRIYQAKRYIYKLNSEHLEIQGYSKKQILYSLSQLKPHSIISFRDIFDYYTWKLHTKYSFYTIYKKSKQFVQERLLS